MKAYIVKVPNPDQTCHPESSGHRVKVLWEPAVANAECKRLNVEEGREEAEARYRVTEMEAPPEAVQSYAAARAAVEAAESRAAEATFAAFLAGCRALFEAHPDLHSFAWRQYVSWSACGFFDDDNVDAEAPDVNGVEGHDVGGRCQWDSETGQWTGKGEPSPLAKLQRAVAGFLLTFDEDDLLALFGVDVCITVRRDGSIETEYYDDGSFETSACFMDEDEDDEDDDFDDDEE